MPDAQRSRRQGDRRRHRRIHSQAHRIRRAPSLRLAVIGQTFGSRVRAARFALVAMLAARLVDTRPLRKRRAVMVAPAARGPGAIAAGLLLVALIVSAAPAFGIRSTDDPVTPRLGIGGPAQGGEPMLPAGGGASSLGADVRSDAAVGAGALADQPDPAATTQSDGRALRPVVLDAGGATASLTAYTVKAGDTLYQIASQHGLTLSTVMWANGLTGPLIHIGQILRLPPADGTIVTVAAGETLDSIAAAAGIDAQLIADYNGLIDGLVRAGQTLVIPGGKGPQIVLPTPTPRPTPMPTRAPTQPPANRASTPAPCATCGFKPLVWPVPGGQISQYFGCTGFWAEPAYGSCAHYHGGIDIWAAQGTPILAAAGGRVTFAGWKSDGGGNQACIDDGAGYTTCYHHMSTVAIVTGQTVSRGQVIGAVGSTGNATGPHLHFEIWIGAVWAGGYRVDPLAYF